MSVNSRHIIENNNNKKGTTMIYLPFNHKNFDQLFNNVDGISSPLIRPAMDVKALDGNDFDKSFIIDTDSTDDGFGICVRSRSIAARMEIEQGQNAEGVEVRTYHTIGGESELVDIEVYTSTEFTRKWTELLKDIATKDIDAIRL